MTSTFEPPVDIAFVHPGGRDIIPSHHYCGVCHGVLKVGDQLSQQENRRDDDDETILRTSSSESFPLPSGASAVGTVHPCGHLFHVSCFRNHNIHKRRKREKSNDPKVQILDNDATACVEIKNTIGLN